MTDVETKVLVKKYKTELKQVFLRKIYTLG